MSGGVIDRAHCSRYASGTYETAQPTPNFTSSRVKNGHLDAVCGELIDDRAERVLFSA